MHVQSAMSHEDNSAGIGWPLLPAGGWLVAGWSCIANLCSTWSHHSFDNPVPIHTMADDFKRISNSFFIALMYLQTPSSPTYMD